MSEVILITLQEAIMAFVSTRGLLKFLACLVFLSVLYVAFTTKALVTFRFNLENITKDKDKQKESYQLKSIRGEYISIKADFERLPEKVQQNQRDLEAFRNNLPRFFDEEEEAGGDAGEFIDDVSTPTEALPTTTKTESSTKRDIAGKTNETKFKFVTRNSIDEEQKIRKSRVTKVCQTELELKGNLFYRDTYAHLYVVDKYKLLFCYIPKVGCSNWKRVLMVLSGKKSSIDNITSHEAHAHNGLKVFRRLNNWQQKYALKNYRKVMFVREPFARILSAYKNKYGDLEVYRNAPQNFHTYATRIIRKYRENPSPEALLTGENITFAEFVEYLTDQRERPNFDRHWKEMYKLCSPCNVKYDFIGKLENLEEEANYVLGSVPGVRDIVSYPAKANSHPTNTSFDIVKETLSPFSNEKLLKLWDIYKLDFNLFGYDKPTFIP